MLWNFPSLPSSYSQPGLSHCWAAEVIFYIPLTTGTCHYILHLSPFMTSFSLKNNYHRTTHTHTHTQTLSLSPPLLSPNHSFRLFTACLSLLKNFSKNHFNYLFLYFLWQASLYNCHVRVKEKYSIWRRISFSWDIPSGSDIKESACNVGDPGSIPGLGRSSGEGNGNPLQYSCLENPMDGGAW